jgi:hypothetical protein
MEIHGSWSYWNPLVCFLFFIFYIRTISLNLIFPLCLFYGSFYSLESLAFSLPHTFWRMETINQAPLHMRTPSSTYVFATTLSAFTLSSWMKCPVSASNSATMIYFYFSPDWNSEYSFIQKHRHEWLPHLYVKLFYSTLWKHVFNCVWHSKSKLLSKTRSK